MLKKNFLALRHIFTELRIYPITLSAHRGFGFHSIISAFHEQNFLPVKELIK